jgi:hypothetical protein
MLVMNKYEGGSQVAVLEWRLARDRDVMYYQYGQNHLPSPADQRMFTNVPDIRITFEPPGIFVHERPS